MKRTFAEWVRAIAAVVPSGVGTAVSGSGVGTAILFGAWLALTALFTFVGNVVLLTVVTTVGQSLGPALILMTVFGVFGTPAASLVLAQRVVAATVRRVETAVVLRMDDPTPDGHRLGSCETNERGRCRTPRCC